MEHTLHDLLVFVRAHAHGRCFRDWPDNIVMEWMKWHGENGNMVVVTDGADVAGVAIGWQCKEEDLEKHWHCGDPDGDCFYFSQIVTAKPQAKAGLVLEFTRRFPQWSTFRLFSRRRGKMKQYRSKDISTFGLHGLCRNNLISA